MKTTQGYLRRGEAPNARSGRGTPQVVGGGNRQSAVRRGACGPPGASIEAAGLKEVLRRQCELGVAPEPPTAPGGMVSRVGSFRWQRGNVVDRENIGGFSS